MLAPPLLALMLWNLAVYAAITVRSLSPRAGAGPLSRLIARAGHAGVARGPSSGEERADGSARAALARFSADWARASARLNGSRVARVLHVAAIAFAAGALAGLYVRGLALEYRAGWESTFLDAPAIHAILSLVLGPASALTGIALPDEARLQAIRFPASAGEPAGPWIHLHAVTVALVVLLPRLALALWHLAVERRLAASFPLALDDAYFTALSRAHRGEVALAIVVPCNHDPSPQTAAALRALACAALGAGARAEIVPAVPYGEEEAAGSRLALGSASKPASLTLALLSSTATPETETHGAFVDSLASALPAGAQLAVIVDESAFVTRFGTDATAARRREERRQAWRGALASREVDPVFVDLERDAPASAGAALREAIDRRARGAAIA